MKKEFSPADESELEGVKTESKGIKSIEAEVICSYCLDKGHSLRNCARFVRDESRRSVGVQNGRDGRRVSSNGRFLLIIIVDKMCNKMCDEMIHFII